MTEAGDFTHIDIPADDLDRAQRFYSEVFGWQITSMEGFPDYLLFSTPAGREGVGGGIGKRGTTAPEQLRNYVLVDSIDETLPKIQAQGGTVVQERLEVPGQGSYLVFKDSEGNELALWERASA
jgi:uncharacterized protein